MGLFSRKSKVKTAQPEVETPKELAEPRGFGTATGGDEPKYWEDAGGRTRENLAKCKTYYNQGGIIGTCIDSYPIMVNRNGYRLEGEDENLVKLVEDTLKNVGFEQASSHALTEAIIYGAGFQEILRELGTVVGLHLLDGSTMYTIKDEHGKITGYKQVTSTDFGQDKIVIFDLDDIVYFEWKWLMMRAWDEITRDVMVAEATAKAIERHGFKKWHIKVGMPGEAVPETAITKLSKKFENLKTDNEITTVHDVNILPLDAAEMKGAEVYNNLSVERLATAFGVPEEILGLGRGSTEATSKTRLTAFYDKIGSIQKLEARVYNQQYIDMITKRPGAVTLVYNDVSPVDDQMKAEYLKTIISATPIDPWAIITPEFARDYLNIKIDETEQGKTPAEPKPVAPPVPKPEAEQ